MANNIWYKDWEKSKSYNNDGNVPFWRPISLTPEEQAQARKNIGVTGSPDITNLENKVDELEGNVATVEGNMDAVSDQFTTLSANAQSALDTANSALSSIGSFSADIYTVSGKADDNASGISSLSAQVGTITANMVSVSGKNTVQDNQISTLSSNVAGLTNSAVYHETKIQNLENEWNSYSADLRNDWYTYSAAEDAVITAATAAIPGQVSAEVSGQLSGKQNNLTPGVNVSLTTAGVIDVMNDNCSAVSLGAIAVGSETYANGVFSFVQGHATSAAGAASHAEGYQTYTQGQRSHAEGGGTSAIGNYSHVEGQNTLAMGQGSHTEGYNTTTNGGYAHAEGGETSAVAAYSHTEGRNTQANSTYAHAEGYLSIADGQFSHAEGQACNASGNGSHAEGQQTTAVGLRSHAEGRGTITDTNYQHVEGQYNAPATGALHVIGNGTTTANRSNIVETYTSGVNVNGNLNVSGYEIVNAIETLGKYMYDNANNAKGKVMFKNIKPTGPSATLSLYNTYDLGNTTLYVATGTAYPQANTIYTTPTGTPGEILAWEGSVGQIMCRQYSTNMVNVSAWPAENLPHSVYNNQAPKAIDYGAFAYGNKYLTELPSGWYNDFISISSVNTNDEYIYSVRQMFRGCTNLTGDVKPWMDHVLSQSAAGQAGNSNRAYYRAGMFMGCTGVSAYATLSADPTYSGFFTVA